DLAPKFLDKVGAQFFLETEPGKCLHAERQKRFADMKTRKFFAFEHNNTTPRFAQQRRRGAAGGAAADYRYVIVFHRRKISRLRCEAKRWSPPSVVAASLRCSRLPPL